MAATAIRVPLFLKTDTGKGQSLDPALQDLHGQVQTVIIPGIGTIPDYNTGNYEFAGVRHGHPVFTDYDQATQAIPSGNTEAEWLLNTGGIKPILTDTNYNSNAAAVGATLEMINDCPSRTGRCLRRSVTAAIADANSSYRLMNWNLFINAVLRAKRYIGVWVWVMRSSTTGKFYREYVTPSSSTVWNFYPGIQIDAPQFVSVSSITSSVPSLTNGQTATITINFSAGMTGLYPNDVTAKAGSNFSRVVGSFTKVNSTQYTMTITAIGLIADVVAAIDVNIGGTRPSPFTPTGSRGYGVSGRVEGTSSGSPQWYANQILTQEDQWVFFEYGLDADQDKYFIRLNGVTQTATAYGHSSGTFDGQWGSAKTVTYGVLGNTVDPRSENGEELKWGTAIVDWGHQQIMIADNSVWANKTKFEVCPRFSCVDDEFKYIINQGAQPDVSEWHVFLVDVLTNSGTLLRPVVQ